MKKNIFWFVLCSVIFSLMLAPMTAATADNSCTLMQAYINEKVLDIIACGDFNLQNCSVKVANQQSKITECGSVSEEKIHVRTTLLVDISTSMPYSVRAKVIEFIETEIKDLSGYEELRLVTFDDKLNVVQDFSSDRYDLSNAAKGIEFNGAASAVYDAINGTIASLGETDGLPCFNRTIVITDGVDYTVGGITKEELFMRLRAETYPIDVVEVSKDKPANPNKDLAALSRISNGSYTGLNSRSDISECVSSVSVSNLFWIRAEVPVNLLDGSTRQVDVSDETNSFSFDLKMSVVDAPIESLASSSTTVKSSTTPFTPFESIPATETLEDNGTEETSSVNILLIVVIAGVVLIAAVFAVALSSIMRKKKDRASETPPVEPLMPPIDNIKTEVLFNDGSRNSYTIKLTSCSDTSQNWTVTVAGDVIVGRADNCDLKFGDKSVSREQFKLSAGDMGVMLSNLSTSNATKVNGVAVTNDAILQLGDIIKFGRVSLSVDLIQKILDDDPPAGNISDRDTMMVF